MFCHAGGNVVTQNTPQFVLGSATSGAIYLNQALDIYNYPIYHLVVAASNSSTYDPSQNVSQIGVDVVVDDIDNYGPSFAIVTTPSPNCSGIGKQVNRGEMVT